MSLAGTKHALTPTSSTSSLSPPKKMPRSDEPGSELQEEASASTSTQLEPNLLGGQTETKIDSKVSSSGSKDDKFEADLLSNLTCGICSDLYYVPVALLPCLHVYCGACAATWLQEHASCPTCRKTVNKVVDSHPTKQMLALYSSLSKETSLHGERTAEEIAYMDGIYQAGRTIEICSDNQEDEEEEEDEDEPLVFRPPCPCCHADNQFNYVCPEPLAENTYSIYSDLPSSHRVCASCNGAFPRREEDEDTFCQRCEKWYCPAFLTCANRGEGPKKLEDQTIYSHTEQIYHNDSLEPYRGMGKYEVKVLADYLRTADGSSSGLLQAYFATQTTLHDSDGTEYNKGSRLCVHCVRYVINAQDQIRNWWFELYPKLVEEGKIPEDVGKRPKCWYGHACRTQHHNASHAERLLHACNPVPPEERKNTPTRRSEVPVPAPAV
ncbi:hypothetical protein BT69DRAFT_1071169 [Atractiella rhizophila]|nr:hypothetical protein BT69DRAFT_1071169 [Atractiella rhizophila]